MEAEIKIAIADDHKVVCDSFAQMLLEYPGVGTIHTAYTGHHLLELLQKHNYTLLLLDVQMREMDGLETLREINKMKKNCKVIFLSSFDDFHYYHKAKTLGAKAYVLKKAGKEQLFHIISEVLQGKYCFPDEYYLKLQAFKESDRKQEALPMDLTPKEREILILVAKEMSEKAIAAELHIVTSTVKRYKQNIFEKIGTHTAVGAALFAKQHGLI